RSATSRPVGPSSRCRCMAMARATAATFTEWVRRLCTASPAPDWAITWVTAESREKYGEKRIRSMSTRECGVSSASWNSSSCSGRRRPRRASAVVMPPSCQLGIASEAFRRRAWLAAQARESINVTSSAFALPDTLADKAAAAVIGADETRLAEIDRAMIAAREDVERRLTAARRGEGDGQDAMDRDIAVYGLVARQTMLRRFAIDLCLGKIVAEDGEVLYIGRTGLVSPEGKRLLIDWRAPAAEPFFAATHQNPMGLVLRRR